VVYLDTGCLVKLYYPERDSELVAARISGETLVYTPLHALELTTAFELKIFRKEATKNQVEEALALVREDIAVGKLVSVDAHLLESLNEAVRIARLYAAKTGCRALDTLHCAWAKNLQISGFLSTDVRQLDLARRLELEVISL